MFDVGQAMSGKYTYIRKWIYIQCLHIFTYLLWYQNLPVLKYL